MRKEISDLVSRNATLQAKVAAEVANSKALKVALDAAIAGQLTAEELQALATVDAGMASAAQKLADSTAENSPSN